MSFPLMATAVLGFKMESNHLQESSGLGHSTFHNFDAGLDISSFPSISPLLGGKLPGQDIWEEVEK